MRLLGEGYGLAEATEHDRFLVIDCQGGCLVGREEGCLARSLRVAAQHPLIGLVSPKFQDIDEFAPTWLFNLLMYRFVRLETNNLLVKCLLYTDDQALIASSMDDLQGMAFSKKKM